MKKRYKVKVLKSEMLECIDAIPTIADATMVLASTDGNAATEGSNVLMQAMRWTASGVRWIFDGFSEMNKTNHFQCSGVSVPRDARKTSDCRSCDYHAVGDGFR